MANFLELFVTFMFLGLAVFGIFAYVIGFQQANGTSQQMITDPYYGKYLNSTYNALYGNLSTTRDKSQTQKQVFESENPTGGVGGLLLFSIVSVGKVFNGMVIGVYNSVIVLPAVVLQLDPVVIGVMTSLLLITIIITAWSLYKGI